MYGEERRQELFQDLENIYSISTKLLPRHTMHSTVSKSGHIRQNKPFVHFSVPHPETLMQISHAFSPSARHRCLWHLLATDEAMAAAYVDARGPSRPLLSQERRHIRQNKTFYKKVEFCHRLLLCQKLHFFKILLVLIYLGNSAPSKSFLSQVHHFGAPSEPKSAAQQSSDTATNPFPPPT